MENKRQVFLVHGRNSKAKQALAAFLNSIDLKVLEWEWIVAQLGKGTPTTLEVVRQGLEMANTIVILMTPDDEAKLHPHFVKENDPLHEKELSFQPRQNVILEAGMALMGKPDETIFVKIGQIRPMTDIDGINYISLNNTIESRRSFIERLKTTGCTVDISTDKWRDAGDFDAATDFITRDPKSKLNEQQRGKAEIDIFPQEIPLFTNSLHDNKPKSSLPRIQMNHDAHAELSLEVKNILAKRKWAAEDYEIDHVCQVIYSRHQANNSSSRIPLLSADEVCQILRSFRESG